MKRLLLKKTLLMALVTLMLFAFASVAYAGTSLTLDKASFLPGPNQNVKVYFSTDYPLHDDAWIGVIPVGVPHGPEAEGDDHDLSYQYVEDAKYDASSKKYVTLPVPEIAGSYEVRMYSSDDEELGTELAYAALYVGLSAPPAATTPVVTKPPVTVTPPPAGPAAGTSLGNTVLTLSQASYLPGANQKVNVYFSTDYPLFDDAWIGIIPSEVPHGPEKEADNYDLTYQYVDDAKYDASSKKYVSLDVPQAAGSYDVRMYSSDDEELGLELASVRLTVGVSSTAPPVTTPVKPPVITPGTTPVITPGAAATKVKLVLDKTALEVNGKVSDMGVAPTIVAGRTLLPIRFVVEALGGTVDWDGAESKFTLKLNGNMVEMWVGKNVAKFGKVGLEPGCALCTEEIIDVAPQIINGRSYVPVRYALEKLGCTIGYDSATRTVTVDYGM